MSEIQEFIHKTLEQQPDTTFIDLHDQYIFPK